MARFGNRPTVPSGYIASDGHRQGKTYSTRIDERCEFEVDRNRILHSAAFRRLSGKTQVFGIGQSDFFRTRLTHSLEVAQIAKGIALRVGANPELCEAAALAHDIGHPPFGHKGEEVLRKIMQPFGGFEANAQNLRVLEKIEVKHPGVDGLDLTRATLDSTLKYKVPFDGVVKKFHYVDDSALVKWVVQGHQRPSFECEIMELADDTAYAAHDLEDGVHAGMITLQRALQRKRDVLKIARSRQSTVKDVHWDWAVAKITQMTQGSRSATEREKKAKRKEAASAIIGEVVRGAKSRKRFPNEPSLRYQRELLPGKDVKEHLEVLKQLNYALLIDDARVQTLEARAEKILEDLHDFFSRASAARAYPEDFRSDFEAAQDGVGRARIACDFIAGMTDQYAERMHQRLFTASRAALFDY